MSPRDWLRNRRRPKYATGGIVSAPKPEDPPLVEPGCRLALPSVNAAAESGAEPASQIVLRHPSSRELAEFAERLRVALQGAVPPATPRLDDERVVLTCRCVAIYSRCYCTTNPENA